MIQMPKRTAGIYTRPVQDAESYHFSATDEDWEASNSVASVVELELANAYKALAFAAGYISSQDPFTEWEPEEVLQWILDEAEQL
jgi:hypothetical protein